MHVRWKKVGSQRNRMMILDAVEFIRRFLNHVLPSGFMKIRYFGFLGSSAKITLEQVHLSIQLASRFELKPPTSKRKTTRSRMSGLRRNPAICLHDPAMEQHGQAPNRATARA